jgi:hypothetical protein
MKIETLDQLKAHNPKAHASLISLWSELSGCSNSSARRYLKEDVGTRHSIIEVNGVLEFTDTEAGDTFKFDGGEWS